MLLEVERLPLLQTQPPEACPDTEASDQRPACAYITSAMCSVVFARLTVWRLPSAQEQMLKPGISSGVPAAAPSSWQPWPPSAGPSAAGSCLLHLLSPLSHSIRFLHMITPDRRSSLPLRVGLPLKHIQKCTVQDPPYLGQGYDIILTCSFVQAPASASAVDPPAPAQHSSPGAPWAWASRPPEQSPHHDHRPSPSSSAFRGFSPISSRQAHAFIAPRSITLSLEPGMLTP